MRSVMHRIFRRAQPVTVLAGGKCVRRRGVILAERSGAQALSPFDFLRGGKLCEPLFIYYGDADELIGAEDARLFAAGKSYRVLSAETAEGFCGRIFVKAVLERSEADDGQCASERA